MSRGGYANRPLSPSFSILLCYSSALFDRWPGSFSFSIFHLYSFYRENIHGVAGPYRKTLLANASANQSRFKHMAVVLVPREVELEVTILFSRLNSPFVTDFNMYTLWKKLEISDCDIVRSIDVFILWKIYMNFYYDVSNRSVIFRPSTWIIYEIPSTLKLLLSELDRKYSLGTANESSSRFERFDKREKEMVFIE